MQKSADDRTIRLQLSLLQEDLARLRSRCEAMASPPDVTTALRQFKELGPAFEAVAAFTSVLTANTTRLDQERRMQVEEQLAHLTTALWTLQLNAVAPRLQRMVDNIDHMPIGTRFVLQRWMKRLVEMREETAVAAGLEHGLLERVETLSRRLAEEAPDLMDLGSP